MVGWGVAFYTPAVAVSTRELGTLCGESQSRGPRLKDHRHCTRATALGYSGLRAGHRVHCVC